MTRIVMLPDGSQGCAVCTKKIKGDFVSMDGDVIHPDCMDEYAETKKPGGPFFCPEDGCYARFSTIKACDACKHDTDGDYAGPSKERKLTPDERREQMDRLFGGRTK